MSAQMLRSYFIFIFLLGCFTAGAQSKIGVAGWTQDIDSLQRQLPALHPDFFTLYPKKDWEQDLGRLKSQLAGKTDFQTALALQTIVAKVGDAQTRLDFTALMLHEKVIPFALSVWAGDLYVSATIQRFAAASGVKILRINGLSTREALHKLDIFVGQENQYTTLRDALTWFRFPEALKMAGITTNDTLNLLVEKKDGQPELVQIYALDPAKPPNRAEAAPVVIQPMKPDLRWQPAQTFFNQLWLPADSVLYVQYNRCLSREMSLAIGDSMTAEQYPSFRVFADSMFNFLAKTPYAKVLIDLRYNAGGDPSDGILWAKRIDALPKNKRPKKLYVATNLFTQGAATEVAYTLASVGAKLIGEPSGTSLNHYDGVRQFFLPNSQVAVQFPILYRQIQKGKSTVLEPKVLIPVSFEQFRNGLDPVLDYVRKN
ncbi:MAG: hypothetical protein ABIO24_02555 [Saprospiraceae bacterium]